jgi:hypothetical protein
MNSGRPCLRSPTHTRLEEELEPVQAADGVARDEAIVGESRQAKDGAVNFEAGDLSPDRMSHSRIVLQQAESGDGGRVALEPCGLGARGDIPEPDRAVPRARGKPLVEQKAERGDNARMALKPSGLGARGDIPEPDRAVPRARGKPLVGQQAERGD